MKYKKIKDLHYDFSYYVSKEGLFGVAFFGHKGNKRKVKYIYNALLKQYKGVNNVQRYTQRLYDIFLGRYRLGYSMAKYRIMLFYIKRY